MHGIPELINVTGFDPSKPDLQILSALMSDQKR